MFFFHKTPDILLEGLFSDVLRAGARWALIDFLTSHCEFEVLEDLEDLEDPDISGFKKKSWIYATWPQLAEVLGEE